MNTTSHHNLPSSSRLARRLVIYVVLISSLVTVFTSVFQLYGIYKSGVDDIDLRFQEIRDSYVGNIASRVWVANQEELVLTLEGILRLPDIQHIRVYENDSVLAELGDESVGETVQRQYSLNYVFRGKPTTIGKVVISASLDRVHQHVIDQALAILVSNAIKTFIVSGFMLLVFYHLIIKHLHRVAAFAEEIGIRNLDRQLVLDRKPHNNEQKDEFDLLVNAFHSMQANLERSVEELAVNENRLQAIMDNTPAMIYVKDLYGHMLLINRELENMLKMTNEEVHGKLTSDILPEDVARQHMENDEQVLRMRRPIEFEEVVPQEDGLHIFHSVKFCLYDNEGEPYAVCGISTDITHQKLNEEQLRRSQKMEAMGKLTGGIAHDFNNMLNVITGYAEILKRSLEDDPRLQKFAREISHAGERGADMTSKLLSLSRDRATRDEKTDINELLREESDLLEKTLTARIELHLQLADELWPVWMDKGDLEDAILNICINAMHAMPDGGEVTITTRNVLLPNEETLSLQLPAGEYVRLSIRDTGVGMDRLTMSKIFDPFFTTKGEAGTGLGMSQVYGFVRRSEGEITLESEPGKGTNIIMYFPRCTTEAQADTRDTTVNEDSLHGNETILVVDDEPSLCMLAREILEARGYTVLVSERGDKAIDLLQRHKVDLLLSDVIMPGMDGYQLAMYVMQHYPHIKIQLASGYASDKLDDGTHDDLRRNLLSKPYTANELLQRVRNLLDEQESGQQAAVH